MKKTKQDELFADLPDLLTAKEVQTALGIGRGSTYRLLRSGEIECFMVATSFKVPKTALISYINKKCKEKGVRK